MSSTCLEDLHVLELLQGVSVIVVCHVDFVAGRLGVFHPGSLVPPIGVMGNWFGDGGQRVLALSCDRTFTRGGVH